MLANSQSMVTLASLLNDPRAELKDAPRFQVLDDEGKVRHDAHSITQIFFGMKNCQARGRMDCERSAGDSARHVAQGLIKKDGS